MVDTFSPCLLIRYAKNLRYLKSTKFPLFFSQSIFSNAVIPGLLASNRTILCAVKGCGAVLRQFGGLRGLKAPAIAANKSGNSTTYGGSHFPLLANISQTTFSEVQNHLFFTTFSIQYLCNILVCIFLKINRSSVCYFSNTESYERNNYQQHNLFQAFCLEQRHSIFYLANNVKESENSNEQTQGRNVS